MKGFQETLEQWDGRTTKSLEALYRREHRKEDFLSEVLRFVPHPKAQSAATWLLKHSIEAGTVLDGRQVGRIITALPKLLQWDAKLHVLQCLPAFDITKARAAKVEDFLESCVQAENKFVRAWAYDGYYRLASAHPKGRNKAGKLLDRALEDEAPSVRARVRKIWSGSWD